ncbi:hypothetical protein [Ferrimonas senticii]|uniref:hypothetical protein n=1 Tax=Ferrimonas senticii TaxID=394566 RepID=UPI00040075E1|nr:hypothetical protein [Ferrimonas senticii]
MTKREQHQYLQQRQSLEERCHRCSGDARWKLGDGIALGVMCAALASIYFII